LLKFSGSAGYGMRWNHSIFMGSSLAVAAACVHDRLAHASCRVR
jgi:hypothetical protein